MGKIKFRIEYYDHDKNEIFMSTRRRNLEAPEWKLAREAVKFIRANNLDEQTITAIIAPLPEGKDGCKKVLDRGTLAIAGKEIDAKEKNKTSFSELFLKLSLKIKKSRLGKRR
ncbi:MAG: hypothetical protein LBT92_03190 [Rickettsiales bacterium]|nr:hypothetical protein [Rickettsiales bacterium]